MYLIWLDIYGSVQLKKLMRRIVIKLTLLSRNGAIKTIIRLHVFHAVLVYMHEERYLTAQLNCLQCTIVDAKK